MVLYIFHVNTGGMLTFDMEMALQTVQNLKETIERLHGIPVEKQVLLISGGEVLQPGTRVCSYSSGTDENPIYMFSTIFNKEKNLLPWPSIESRKCYMFPQHHQIHYEDEVSQCLQMPPDYNTVVVRAKLAHKMFESATKEIKLCERLVFEQHLQQQGWAAVIANLEDLTNEFKQRNDDFSITIDEYLSNRENMIKYLETFQDDLQKLSTVPILNEILPSAQEDFHGFDEYFQDTGSFGGSNSATSGNSGTQTQQQQPPQQQSDESNHSQTSLQTTGALVKSNTPSQAEQETEPTTDESSTTNETASSSTKSNRSLTLLQWISTKENHQSLQEMAEDCARVMTHFDETAIKNIKGAIKLILIKAEQESIREVRGLTQRLEQLDELMRSAKNIVREQSELSTAFQQNQSRASNLGDASIFPDLCMSHSSQLTVMLKNHNKLLDIEKRIMKAKEELADNLIRRLEYVVYVQSAISDLDSKLLFHHRCFRRLKHHFVIIEQIHHAPTVYVSAVTEVVRRKIFSNSFIKWANDLASHLLTIYDEEVLRRQDFNAIFENHFLTTLFNGLEDMPPSFGTQAPPVFDNRLPNLNRTDLETLKSTIPDIASNIELPDLKKTLDFFSHDLVTCNSSEINKALELLKLGPLKPSLQAQLRDEIESETDTEEYEKVSQMPCDQQQQCNIEITVEQIDAEINTDAVELRSVETWTEENIDADKEEIVRLKVLLQSMHRLSYNSIGLLRKELSAIKNDTNKEKDNLLIEFDRMKESWTSLSAQRDNSEREQINRLTVDHELELDDIRKMLAMKDDELATLKCDNKKLLENLANTQLNGEQSKKQLTDEIDKLRSRLDSYEERANEFESEKEKAVNELKEQLNREHKTEIESLRCRYKLLKNMDRSPSDTSLEKIDRPDLIDYDRSGRSTLLASSPKSPTTEKNVYRRILDEKERQLDVYTSQIQSLKEENEKLKGTVQQLTECDHTNKEILKLKEHNEQLYKDVKKLKSKLSAERTRRMELRDDLSSSSDVPTVSTSGMKVSTIEKIRCCYKCIRTDSCEPEDVVLVLWNETLRRYIVAQESQYLHFLAEDSHPLFQLPVPSTRDITFENIEKPSFFIGVVTHKQYCVVKKEGTRYRVPVGTKFCRIRMRPLSAERAGSSTDLTKSEEKKRPNADKDKDKLTKSTIHLPVSRSLSIQMMDSFAQTENPAPELAKLITSLVDKDMVDSGVDAQQRQSDRISINEDDNDDIGAASLIYEDRYRSASEEDEAVIVDNRSSQENSTADASGGGIGFFTLIEPLITPIQLFLDK